MAMMEAEQLLQPGRLKQLAQLRRLLLQRQSLSGPVHPFKDAAAAATGGSAPASTRVLEAGRLPVPGQFHGQLRGVMWRLQHKQTPDHAAMLQVLVVASSDLDAAAAQATKRWTGRTAQHVTCALSAACIAPSLDQVSLGCWRRCCGAAVTQRC